MGGEKAFLDECGGGDTDGDRGLLQREKIVNVCLLHTHLEPNEYYIVYYYCYLYLTLHDASYLTNTTTMICRFKN